MKTIGSCESGRDNNFNLLRLGAALMVMFHHCYPVSLGQNAVDPFTAWSGQSLGSTGVNTFFVISGYLIARSFVSRRSLAEFAMARVLRIYPALVTSVLVTALVTGVFFSPLPFSAFLVHPMTASYVFGNATLYGYVQELPGVFSQNPYANAVNGSLWSLPYEVKMYVLAAALGLLALLQNRSAFNTLYVLLLLFVFRAAPIFPSPLWLQSSLFFLSGTFLFVNRDEIPLSTWAFCALAAAAFALARTAYAAFFYNATLIYGVVWFAYVPAGAVRSYNRIGDYSYGLYVYAFPVQQCLAALLPGIGPLQLFPLALAVTGLVAAASWHGLEKPALQLKARGERLPWLRAPVASAAGGGETR